MQSIQYSSDLFVEAKQLNCASDAILSFSYSYNLSWFIIAVLCEYLSNLFSFIHYCCTCYVNHVIAYMLSNSCQAVSENNKQVKSHIIFLRIIAKCQVSPALLCFRIDLDNSFEIDCIGKRNTKQNTCFDFWWK